MKKRLYYCDKCKEKSMTVKIYNNIKRVKFCINKGCDNKFILPDIKIGEIKCQN